MVVMVVMVVSGGWWVVGKGGDGSASSPSAYGALRYRGGRGFAFEIQGLEVVGNQGLLISGKFLYR